MPNHNRNSRRSVVQARHVVREPDPVVVVAQALNETGTENTNKQLRARIKSLEKDIKIIKKSLLNQERAHEKLQYENSKLRDDLKYEQSKGKDIDIMKSNFKSSLKIGKSLGYIKDIDMVGDFGSIIWNYIYDKKGNEITLKELGEDLIKLTIEHETMRKAFAKTLEDLKGRNDAAEQYRNTIRTLSQLFPEAILIYEDGEDPKRPDAFNYGLELTGLAKASPEIVKRYIEKNKKLTEENEQLKKQLEEDDLLFQDVNQ